MGEIADAMIDGEFDYITGEYLGRGCGYPRTLERGYNKKSGAYGGVVNFCMQKGKTQSKANDIIKRYGREILKIDTPKARGIKTWKEDVMPTILKISEEIQKDFNAFRKWFVALQ